MRHHLLVMRVLLSAFLLAACNPMSGMSPSNEGVLTVQQASAIPRLTAPFPEEVTEVQLQQGGFQGKQYRLRFQCDPQSAVSFIEILTGQQVDLRFEVPDHMQPRDPVDAPDWWPEATPFGAYGSEKNDGESLIGVVAHNEGGVATVWVSMRFI